MLPHADGSGADIPSVTVLRRRFHEHAETGGHEFETVATITHELDECGIPWRMVAPTGLLGILDTGRPGRTLVMRTDIDALPIAEDPCNLKGRKVVVSSNPGAGHLCGHDAHMAMLLTAARELAAKKDGCPKTDGSPEEPPLCGRIIFAFEPKEEVGNGFVEIVDALEHEHVDAVWGIHVRWDLPAGRISVEAGPRMAGPVFFDVTVRGQGSHGSNPHLGVDPVLATANITCGLQEAISREIDPLKMAVLTVTSIQGGDTDNVIPDSCRFMGSMRYLEPEVGAHLEEAFHRIVDGTAATYRCTVEKKMRKLFGPVINDAAMSALAERAVRESLGEGALVRAQPWIASDSFAAYLERWPGVYAFLGVRNDDLGSGAPHHSPRFDIDETALPAGVAASVRFAQDYLRGDGEAAGSTI